jgi:hypothetical protein
MAIGIIGWDAEGQPMYGDIGNGPAGSTAPGVPSYNGGPVTQQRPVNTPTVDPSTGQQRPVTLPPSIAAAPQLQGNYNDWQTQQDSANDWYQQWQYGTLKDRQANQNDWETGQQQQIDKLPGIYQQQADMRAGNTAGLRSAFEGYNASDLAATNKFVSDNNANLGIYNQRANDLYNTPAQMYTAQTWSSNPQDIAQQQQALGQFSDIYGGSLDYQAAQAQAAQAQAVMAQLYQYASDPSDVKRQQEAIQQLKGMINGGEWSDNLRDVTKKYKDLSDPEITAQERYIMEQFNQQRDDLERSNREAVMSNLAGRGLRSGAAEQTGMLNTQQELGRQSVLSSLGAEANAVNRSQQAMQGWSQASQAGRAAQLQAMGMYVDAAGNLRAMNDQVGEFNTHEANTNSIANAAQASETNRYNAGLQTQTNIANAGFTNDAYANNQRARVAGAEGYANQANSIRSANDLVGTFNTGQQNLVGMQNQREFNNDLDRKASLAQGQLFNNTSTGQVSLDAVKSTNAGNAGRDSVIHDDQQSDIDSWTAGMLAPVGAQIGFNDQKLTNRNGLSDTTSKVGSDLYGGVFTPTIGTRKTLKDQLAGNIYQLNSGG